MRKFITEFIGTFFLVLTIGFSVLGNAPLAPLAIGCALMVMVYMGGHISGAHYNPAVTLAVALRGKCGWGDVVCYWISQILAACVAAFVVYAVRGDLLQVQPAGDYMAGKGLWLALLCESLLTFALALVVLNVATSEKTEGNSFYGLAIGFTVFAGAVSVGPISGGAFNPAVGLGPWIIFTLQSGHFDPSIVWIYLVGPLLGGALAAVVFRLQSASKP
jgi:aquaporin Z